MLRLFTGAFLLLWGADYSFEWEDQGSIGIQAHCISRKTGMQWAWTALNRSPVQVFARPLDVIYTNLLTRPTILKAFVNADVAFTGSSERAKLWDITPEASREWLTLAGHGIAAFRMNYSLDGSPAGDQQLRRHC